MKILKSIALGLVGLGMSAVATAAPLPTWTDVHDPANDVYFTNGINKVGVKEHGVPDYSYQHDITNDGFVVGTDVVGSFILTLELFDDELVNGKDGEETVIIDLPGTAADTSLYVDFFDIVTGVSLEGIVQLNSTGLLDVTLYHSGKNNQDFFFGGSTLVAVGVPEPSTVLLLGAGAGLLGFAARRKQRLQVQAA